MYAAIVMEWMPHTLAGVMCQWQGVERNLVPVTTVSSWLVQMAFGVAAIHSVGWMHRDIKPANILMSADKKQCMVADLGLGRPMHVAPEQDMLSEAGSAHDAMSMLSGYTEKQGSPWYMSPEAHGIR